jgi:glucose/arabinose dehydrogenase
MTNSNTIMKPCLYALLVVVLGMSALPARAYLKVETVPLPEGTPPEIGALAFDPDGKLYVATRRNDIFVATPASDPNAFEWKLFASGFHNALGMEAPAPGHLLVTQMAELTEVIDTDADGSADTYNNLNNEIGLSGNYHETNGLCPDGDGGYFIAAGTASHNGPTFWKTHGKYSKIGRRGRNYSAVQWKGWVMHYKKAISGRAAGDQRERKRSLAGQASLIPYASGFRMHNGILRDSKGRLWCGDNQGDFRATSPLYLVEKGNFYGHPSSLVWDKNFPKNKDPLNIPQKELDEMRTHATVLIPHAEMNRSCAEPAEIPAAFGIFPGQLIIADNNNTRITRIMLDEVGGKLQGSCTHFINGLGLRTGNNRLEWSPDGKQLYVGQTVRGWGKPSEGIQRLSFTGKTPFDVEQIKLTKTGFELTTTLPVANLDEAEISINSFHYQDSFKYGGGQLDKKTIPVTKAASTADKTVTIDLESLQAGKVYHINIKNLKSKDGSKLHNENFYYTANQLH